MILHLLFTGVFLLSNTNCGKLAHQADSDEMEMPVDSIAIVPEEPVKRALLVGINDYKSSQISDLEGCINDVENMKNLLIGKFGFEAENIIVLKNKDATHDSIVKAFQRYLIDPSDANDIVVFHYSGHGSQMKDLPDSAGDEIDGKDETIVPYDSRQGNVFDITDDELNGLLSSLSGKTKHITVILDSCHSGTGLRASGKTRTIPADDRDPPVQPQAHVLSLRGVEEGTNDVRLKNMEYSLISGCQSQQNSFEHYANGTENGALTYHLVSELMKSQPGTTYRDIMKIVSAKVQAIYPNQLPQLEGTDLDKVVFSDTLILTLPYVIVSPPTSGKVRFNGGQAHGFALGSVFRVFGPNTRDFSDTTKAIASIEITEIGPFESHAKIIKGQITQAQSRAVETHRVYPNLILRVYYENLTGSPILQSIKRDLEEYPFLQPVTTAHGYQLLLAQRGNKIVLEGSQANQLSAPVLVSDPNPGDQIVNKVLKWARWHNILAIENKNPAQRIQFSLTTGNSAGTTPSAALDLKKGDSYSCHIRNTSSQDLYVSVVDISSDGSIEVIYPYPEGASELLRKDTTITIGFGAGMPDDFNKVTDILKVFATSKPMDFHSLTQPMIKGDPVGLMPANGDPLSGLFYQALTSFTRSAIPQNIPQGSWETREVIVNITK